MSAFVDITGHTYGRWTVLHRVPNDGRRTTWWCRCACGVERAVEAANLRGRASSSCGCFMLDRAREANTTHGGSGTPEHRAWKAMIGRCERKTSPDYADYGGRGITVSPAWRDSFERFLADIGPRPSPAHSLDRKNVNGNYDFGNCRWATPTQQARNKRTNRIVRYLGRDMTLAEACERAGLPASLVSDRLRVLGWSIDRALSTPVHAGISEGKRRGYAARTA